MNPGDWSDLIALLEGAKRGLHFGEGLSDVEVQRAEESYGVRFPPDLRAFLQTALPLGSPFPNWRIADDPIAREAESLVLRGILFDVEENGVWLPEWGQRPGQLDDAKALVAEHVKKAPRLIPIYGHRMMPDRPHLNSNPIFSIHQTDMIYYGFNLDDYFRHEFDLPNRKPWPSKVRSIEFWEPDRWQEVRWR
jgi:hypothetical protein